MAEQLGQNQIIPQARPLGAFLQPGRNDVAAPAQPAMLPQGSGVRTLAQAATPSVQGSNQLAELAQALAPFSRGLIQLGAAGAELYADQQYAKGENEAARAQVLANQQMQRSREEFAATGRKLAQKDPIAALMLDRVNPWREAGRFNRLNRIAGQEILPAVMSSYRDTPGVEELRPGSAELKQLQAQAIQGVLGRYGVDENSPGFVEYVAPQIGLAGQKLAEAHWDDHAKHQKDTVWRLAGAEALAIYERALETGSIEWVERTVGGQELRRSASLSESRAAWQRGVEVEIGRLIEGLRHETGIQGETTKMRRMALEMLSQNAKDLGFTELGTILRRVEVAPPRADGKRITAEDLYAPDILKSEAEIENIRYQQATRNFEIQQRIIQQGVDQFQSQLAARLDGVEEGPARGEITRRTVQEWAKRGVPLYELLKEAEAVNKTATDLPKFFYDDRPMDQFLQEIDQQEGTMWDTKRNNQQFESLLRATVDPSRQGEVRRQYAAVVRRKEQDQADIPLSLVNPIVAAKMKANLRLYYPSTVSEAALRNADVPAMMAWGNANVARSAQLQHMAYMKQVSAALAQAAGRKGSKLTSAEILSVASDAVEGYGKASKDALEALFPGSGLAKTPSVAGPAAMPPPSAGAPPPKVYPSFQLDNMPDRERRLKGGEPVMARPSVQEELGRMLNGGVPSPPVRRAARDAGMSPAQFLLRQLDSYPGGADALPPAERQRLLRSSRDAQGAAAKLVGMSRGSARPVDRQNAWWNTAVLGAVDSLMGTRPAAAAQWQGRDFTGRPGPESLARRGRPFERPISVVYETPSGQPGVDLYFPSKRFPAVLGGVVKDVSAEPGYGNYVVVESMDPLTGKKVDVLYSHLAAKSSLRRGQPVLAGDIIGTQGGTGNVRSADGTIASIDFFAPRPPGSRDMTPYPNYDRLRRHVVSTLQSGGSPAAAPASGMTGVATFYTGSGGSDGVAGGPTANGEIYDPRKMTAAVQWGLRDRFLNKWVRVEDVGTGRSVRVWVNDVGQMGGTKQGPSRTDPRLIDLSPAAFRRLFGGTSRGTGRVRIMED